jgi:hypothetical protein
VARVFGDRCSGAVPARALFMLAQASLIDGGGRRDQHRNAVGASNVFPGLP